MSKYQVIARFATLFVIFLYEHTIVVKPIANKSNFPVHV